jgi:hypothetical protein
MGFFARFQNREKGPILTGQAERAESGVVGEDVLWRAVKQAEEDGHGPDISPVDLSTSEVGDPYDRGEYVNLGRPEIGLPVAEGSREGIVANPNAMGNERITGRVLTEGDGPESSAQVLSPEMDAYIQTQMAEQTAAEQAKDQDRKPVTEN